MRQQGLKGRKHTKSSAFLNTAEIQANSVFSPTYGHRRNPKGTHLFVKHDFPVKIHWLCYFPYTP